MFPNTTVEDYLRKGENALIKAGVEYAAMESRILMALATGMDKITLIAHPELPLSQDQIDSFMSLIHRRSAREPMAYLRGFQEFYGLEFMVSKDTLVPRPETEMLVDYVIQTLAHMNHPVIIDVGAGTGCIGISAAVNHPLIHILSIDINWNALCMTRRNAIRHGVENRLSCLHCNLLAGIGTNIADIIVSNPPYIPDSQIPFLQPEVGDYEPNSALDGGWNGWKVIEKLLDEAKDTLKIGGILAFEIGAGMGDEAPEIIQRHGWKLLELRKDYSGIDRMVITQPAK